MRNEITIKCHQKKYHEPPSSEEKRASAATANAAGDSRVVAQPSSELRAAVASPHFAYCRIRPEIFD